MSSGLCQLTLFGHFLTTDFILSILCFFEALAHINILSFVNKIKNNCAP